VIVPVRIQEAMAKMKHIAFAVLSIFFLAEVHSTSLKVGLLSVMDDYVATMEKERARMDFTKEIDVGESLEKRIAAFKSFGGGSREAGATGFAVRRLPLPSVERLEVDAHSSYYERRRPKIDFAALLKNITKGMKNKTIAKIPLNKNLQAMNQVQFGMLEAGAMKESIGKEIIEKQILEACDAKQYILARKLIGYKIYNAFKEEDNNRSRRSIFSTKEILDDIKSKIGRKKYNELMAYDGGVTLAFALDTTGSMSDDIDAAKTIVFGIVTNDRAFSVDYVLSPFNDPASDPRHGPVTYMDKTEKYEFLKLVSKIQVDGGGDCDELAISGARNIFGSSLQYRSPIYVLTDAGPKDATEDHLDAVKEMIISYKTPINFFLSNAGCLNTKAINVYKTLARYSGGQILYFSDKRQIASTTQFIQKGLIGGSSMPVTPLRLSKLDRKKRSIVEIEYSITVDDSVDVLSTAIMDRSNVDAKLYRPDGKLQEKGKINTGKGALFLVDKPAPGEWKIKCPSCSLQSYITSNSISLENIDFDYSFLVDVKIEGKSNVIASNYPIKGKESTVIITVPAHGKTDTSSYKLQVVDDALKTLRTVSLKQYGRAPGRYKGSFPTPSSEFTLVLKGRTKKNKPFKRLANGLVEPKSAIIHMFSAPKGLSLQAGSKSSTRLTFALHCYNGKEMYNLKVNEPKTFSVMRPKGLECSPNRVTKFSVSFKAPISAKRGKIHNVVITVTGKRSGVKASKHIQLLIV